MSSKFMKLAWEAKIELDAEVGACIVDENENVLAIDVSIGDHAERNVINKLPEGSLKNCTLYTTLHPCNMCADFIDEAGIKQVYYYENKYECIPLNERKLIQLGIICEYCGIDEDNNEI